MLFYFCVYTIDLLVVPQAFYGFFIKQQLKQAAKVKLDLCGEEAKSPEQTVFLPQCRWSEEDRKRHYTYLGDVLPCVCR